MKNFKIGLLGLLVLCGNKGCEALSYSFLEILNRIAKRNNVRFDVIFGMPFSKRFFVYSFLKFKSYYSFFPKINGYTNLNISYGTYFGKKNHYISKNLKTCKIIFDFTGGDSFSDIYGSERFFRNTHLKKKIIDLGIKLVLGSQTIGPFNDKSVQDLANEVIKESHAVFTRDLISKEYCLKISGIDPILTTDVAFVLPYSLSNKEDSSKIDIGFNPSGLLWSGGYTNNNQFNLKLNYKDYCIELLKKLCNDERYRVHLIPHSFFENLNGNDNDFVPCYELNKMFPNTIIAPFFKTPMEAKSYIANMNFFIGARMHATIAAFSASIPVVPFAYSRKFEGLYNDYNYDFIIDGRKLDTNQAVEKSLFFIENMDMVNESVQNVKGVIDKNVDNMIYFYEQVINSVYFLKE